MTALQQERPVEIGAVRLPSVNLLPPEVLERERLGRVRLGVGGAALVTLGVLGALYVGAAGSVTSAERSLDEARDEQRRLQAETGRFAEVTAVQAQVEQAESMLVQAMGEEVRWSRFLDDTALTVPERVWLTTLSFSQSAPGAAGSQQPADAGIGRVALSGVARSHEDIAVWLEKLAEQDGYTAPHLTNATEALVGDTKVVNWTVQVTLTPDALSGRYAQPGS